MTNLTIGVLHPGEMGSTVGASARANVSRVLWASEEKNFPVSLAHRLVAEAQFMRIVQRTSAEG